MTPSTRLPTSEIATGNGGYSGLDVSFLQRVIAGLDTGFAAFQLLDPVIVGDITGNGSLSGLDASYLQQYVAGLPSPHIPARPAGVSIVQGGPDPLIWVPRDLSGAPGQSIAVPVLFRQTEPDGRPIELQAFDLVIEFDPGVFTVSNVRPGPLAAGFGLLASVDNGPAGSSSRRLRPSRSPWRPASRARWC